MVNYVLIACDDNPAYLNYWPIVRDAWLKFSPAKPLLLHIGEKDHPEAILNLRPIRGIPTANLAKAVRLITAQSNDLADSYIMLSDMDMIPLNKGYFHSHFSQLDEEHFFVLTSDAYFIANFYPICYLAATQKIWKEIVNPYGLKESELLNSLGPMNLGTKNFCDETVLKLLLDRWDSKERQLACTRGWIDGIARWRIDRRKWEIDYDVLEHDEYVDAHMPPYGECADFKVIENYVYR